ncbi:Zinc finger, CCHC domain-containing protein [Modicella reniformis]|uniref:polynucleotide adenylyltransferase n=1 Tax=Modicella reniformis TaxID=1440133 RepID=A0A9P6J4K8_9FUNG|nr:Zinc finger, CCHC domain-containing protein [Modicella reniformis]
MHRVARVLWSARMKKVMAIPSARVPIVKFCDPKTNIQCDINSNHVLGIYNSEMIRCYTLIDGRVKPLIYNLKALVKNHNINDSSMGYLSSYAYVIMVIGFLQAQEPPILPVLQAQPKEYMTPCHVLLEHTGREGKGVIDCTYDRDPTRHRYFGAANRKSIGQLLIEFFEFYSRYFDYQTMEVNIRLGGGVRVRDEITLARAKGDVKNIPRNGEGEKKLIVMDPFLRDRNVAGVCTPFNLARIWGIFEDLYLTLSSGVFQPIPNVQEAARKEWEEQKKDKLAAIMAEARETKRKFNEQKKKAKEEKEEKEMKMKKQQEKEKKEQEKMEKMEQEKKEKKEQEMKAKEEQEMKAKEEQEKKDQEMRAKEEQEMKAKKEQEMKAKEEQEKKMKKEQEKKAKDEQEKKVKKEQEMKAKEAAALAAASAAAAAASSSSSSSSVASPATVVGSLKAQRTLTIREELKSAVSIPVQSTVKSKATVASGTTRVPDIVPSSNGVSKLAATAAAASNKPSTSGISQQQPQKLQQKQPQKLQQHQQQLRQQHDQAVGVASTSSSDILDPSTSSATTHRNPAVTQSMEQNAQGKKKKQNGQLKSENEKGAASPPKAPPVVAKKKLVDSSSGNQQTQQKAQQQQEQQQQQQQQQRQQEQKEQQQKQKQQKPMSRERSQWWSWI